MTSAFPVSWQMVSVLGLVVILSSHREDTE